MSSEKADNVERPYGYADEKGSNEDRIESVVPGKLQEEIAHQAQSLEEKRLVRRLDMRILPIACLLYLFACEF